MIVFNVGIPTTNTMIVFNVAQQQIESLRLYLLLGSLQQSTNTVQTQQQIQS